MLETALAVTFVIALYLGFRWRAATLEISALTETHRTATATAGRELEALRANIAGLEVKVSRLSKWESVAAADETAANLLRQAQVDADILKNQALGVQRAADA